MHRKWMEMRRMDDPDRLRGLTVTWNCPQPSRALDEFKGAWKALAGLPRSGCPLCVVGNHRRPHRPLRIEGAKLTDREVERLFVQPGYQAFATRDEQEVAGYAEAMETVFAHWNVIDLTENQSASCIAIC